MAIILENEKKKEKYTRQQLDYVANNEKRGKGDTNTKGPGIWQKKIKLTM